MQRDKLIPQVQCERSRWREGTADASSKYRSYAVNLRSGPVLAVLIHSLSLAPAKIGPDTNSYKLVLLAARFWPQCWLAFRAMPQDLIGCWNQQKLKALIPRVSDSTQKWMIRRQRRERFCCLFIVNMYHGNSDGRSFLPFMVRICFICGTNVSVSRSWIPLRVVDREKGAYWLTTKRARIKFYYVLPCHSK